MAAASYIASHCLIYSILVFSPGAWGCVKRLASELRIPVEDVNVSRTNWERHMIRGTRCRAISRTQ